MSPFREMDDDELRFGIGRHREGFHGKSNTSFGRMH
jgi:hypothetical protein